MARNITSLVARKSITSLTPPKDSNFHVPYEVAIIVARALYGDVEITAGISKEELQRKLTTAYKLGIFDYILAVT
jgi:hypothetical protein